MKTPRIDIGSIRRQQIVDAAAAVIAERGLQSLSLSEIEKKAGMSRGQLTYYFQTKEEIFLAVFDRLLELMLGRCRAAHEGTGRPMPTGWEVATHMLRAATHEPHANPVLDALHHTFLAQMGHRDDFRRRLATLYEDFRRQIGRLLADAPELKRAPPGADPELVAALLHALLTGLSVQLAADPKAFDREKMLNLCQDVLGNYLNVRPTSQRPLPASPRTSSGNGVRARKNGRRPGKPARPEA